MCGRRARTTGSFLGNTDRDDVGRGEFELEGALPQIGGGGADRKNQTAIGLDAQKLRRAVKDAVVEFCPEADRRATRLRPSIGGTKAVRTQRE